MKNNNSAQFKIVDHELEKFIKRKDAELKNLARKLGKNYAERKLPALVGDKLIHYIGEFKSGYEQLISYTYKKLQPLSQIPGINTDRKNLEEEEKTAKEQVKKLEELNSNDKTVLEGKECENVSKDVKTIYTMSALPCIAETFFNALAFQFLGENKLFSIVISFFLTLFIVYFAHVTGTHVKNNEAENKKSIVFLSIVFVGMTALFYVLAMLRSLMFKKLGTDIGAFAFIIVNLFLFAVTAFISYKYSPTKEEKQKFNEYKKLEDKIKARENEIKQTEQRIKNLNAELVERGKMVVEIKSYADHTIEEIKKLYNEAVEIFKGANLMFRTDRKVPDCFSEKTPELEYTEINFTNFNNKEE
ncbi:MAG: hypothetical protein WC223_01420 [Bacteroidales bacterium]|jgi:hypothetical protein